MTSKNYILQLFAFYNASTIFELGKYRRYVFSGRVIGLIIKNSLDNCNEHLMVLTLLR